MGSLFSFLRSSKPEHHTGPIYPSIYEHHNRKGLPIADHLLKSNIGVHEVRFGWYRSQFTMYVKVDPEGEMAGCTAPAAARDFIVKKAREVDPEVGRNNFNVDVCKKGGEYIGMLCY
jgi:hypothetical protein